MSMQISFLHLSKVQKLGLGFAHDTVSQEKLCEAPKTLFPFLIVPAFQPNFNCEVSLFAKKKRRSWRTNGWVLHQLGVEMVFSELAQPLGPVPSQYL